MTVNERIQLRDRLFDILLSEKCIIKRKSTYILYRKNLNKVLSNNNELKNLYNSYVSEFRSKEEAIFNLLNHDDYINYMCPICRTNICAYSNRRYEYMSTCGNKSCIKAKISSDEAKQKRANTNLNKYGVKNPFQSEKCKQKGKETCLKKYKVDNASKSDIIKNKIINSNIKKYNVKCSLQNKEVQEKSKKTMINKYGVEHALQNKELLNKAKETCLKRHGVENIFQSKELIDKIIKINLNKYGVKHPSQKNINHYDIWIDDNKFAQHIVQEYNKNKMFLSLKNIANHFNVDSNTIKYRIDKLNLLDYFYIQDSNLELNFKEFLNTYDIHHKRRHIIFGDNNLRREIDFLIDNIGFEINDISTHNAIGSEFISPKDQYYHKNKTDLAKFHNIRLIHIWEWELRNKSEWFKLSNWILNLLNQSKIKASLDDLKLVTKSEELKFLEKYSITSYQKDLNKCIGIYHNNELIETLSFKGNILSICVKFGYELVEETQKIIQYYMKFNNLNSIITYIDLSKFTGKTLEDIGFKLINHVEPQIILCNKKMNHLNKINDEKDYKDYIPIYDCGFAIYQLERGNLK